ncbi:hypothetical protein DH86_00001418, partial [Scytalidium sp. 3C]
PTLWHLHLKQLRCRRSGRNGYATAAGATEGKPTLTMEELRYMPNLSSKTSRKQCLPVCMETHTPTQPQLRSLGRWWMTPEQELSDFSAPIRMTTI